MKEKIVIPEKAKGVWYCEECGRPINSGYTYKGRCVVCAEKYLNPEYVEGGNN